MNKNFPKENMGNRYDHVGLKFEYNLEVENIFKGIIYHFTNQIVGNLDDRAVVKMISSSVNYVFQKVWVYLDDYAHYFQSDNLQNS